MKSTLFILLCLMTASSYSRQNDIIWLWPGNVPGETAAKKDAVPAPSRNDNVFRIAEVTNPSLEVFPADKANANGAAVIVCPGGGYNILAYDKEGTEVAGWLNKSGITAFVLKYRVPNKREGALQDVQRALRLVKSNAAKWNLDTSKIGVMGFSAGGSLSARASTMYNRVTYPPVDKADKYSCRPSFALLIYPAYLDQGPGKTLTEEFQMSREVPPMFIFQTADDTFANSSLVMTGALKNNKVPVELHILPAGGHGYGLRPGIAAAETWPVLAEKWLAGILSDRK